jgi:hypothetical protein
MQQRRRVNEFDERSRFNDGMAVASAGPADQDDEEGAQTLPATGDDVFGYLVNQGDGAFEPRPDYAVDGFEIRLNECPDFF